MSKELFVHYLNQLETLPDSEMQFLLESAREVNFKKDEYFYNAGDMCHTIWFVYDGMAKSLYTHESGKVFIKNFITPGSFVAPFLEMTHKIPTRDSILAKTDINALAFDFEILDIIQERHPNWIKMYMKIMQGYYFLKEQREYEFLMLDASERYKKFCQQYEHMLPHIAQHEIASFLGITKTSLSRIVKNLKEEA